MTTAASQPIQKNALLSLPFNGLLFAALLLMSSLKDYHFTRAHYLAIACLAYAALHPLIPLIRRGLDHRGWMLLLALGLIPAFIFIMSVYALFTRDFNYTLNP